MVRCIKDLLHALFFLFSHSLKWHLEFLKLVDLMNPKGQNILWDVKTWASCVQKVLIPSCLYSYHNAFKTEGNFIRLGTHPILIICALIPYGLCVYNPIVRKSKWPRRYLLLSWMMQKHLVHVFYFQPSLDVSFESNCVRN